MFEPFPKLARLKRGCVVTEKIDGTNAQVLIVNPETLEDAAYDWVCQNKPLADVVSDTHSSLYVYAGSRTRMITPGSATDNYGFAAWVQENASELAKLGEGRHFGEWYGRGIQRGYGLDERRFALFNTARPKESLPACVEQVPVLSTADFSTENIDAHMRILKVKGSAAVPGFMAPEGIVVYHTASRTSFKRTFEHDETGKERAA